MNEKTILSFGEVLWDLLPGGSVLGGAPFNFAYRLHSLQYQSRMVSRLGRDEYGQQAWGYIQRLGMDTRFIQWGDTKPTGTVQITLDERNQPDYYIVPDVAYDEIQCTDAMLDAAVQADCICFGTLAQRSETSRRTLWKILENASHALKLLDINLRKNCYSTETIQQSLQQADVLKLNEQEAPFLAELFSLPKEIPGFCAALMTRWPLSQCLVTLGERGVFAVSLEGEAVYEPGYKIQLVDPCGSGDAFTAGFLDRFFRGWSLRECCRFGNALGALVATQPGATVPISLEEIQRFMESNLPSVRDDSLQSYME